MNFNWCLSIRCSIHTLFISLVFCSISSISSNDDSQNKLDNLKVACGLDDTITDMRHVTLKTVPRACTSIILRSSDFENFNTVFKNTPSVPVYMLHDFYYYNDWVSYFSSSKLNLNQFITPIDNFHLAGIIFDYFYPPRESDTEDQGINRGIPLLFNAIRNHYEQTSLNIPALAIALPLNLKLTQKILSVCEFDGLVDFYYWNTMPMTTDINSIHCNDPLYSITNISTAFTEFPTTNELKCISPSKIVMEVNLFVLDEDNTRLSYGQSCSLCPGDVVFLNPLNTMQRMGQLVSNYKLAGGAVMYVNLDDIVGNCSCPLSAEFPGLSAFVSGMKNEDKCWNCLSYGIPGICSKYSSCPGCHAVPEICKRP